MDGTNTKMIHSMSLSPKTVLTVNSREKKMTIEKQFFNRVKTVSYSFDIWEAAENYFGTINQAKLKGSDVKIHLTGETFLVSSIWGEYQRRYTGIHRFDMDGMVQRNSGVNLDDDEWGMLTFNFDSITEAFAGKKDALKNIFTRPKEDRNMIKVYKAEWYLNGEMITNTKSGREFFSREKAEHYAYCRKPVPGTDYPQIDVLPELRVDFEVRPAPEDTQLMNLVLVETVKKMIEAESKANCEACQVNSDSQFDHCQSGNCLDEDLDVYENFTMLAYQKVKCITLMNVFDQVRKDMGLKQIMSSQLAKCALAYIPKFHLVKQMQDCVLHNSTLMEAVRSAYTSVMVQ